MSKRKPSKKSKMSVAVEPKKPTRLSTGGTVLPDLPPVAPLPKGERYDPLELGRGFDTGKPPRRVIGPHGIPPRGLSDHEKRIHFVEGMGSIESRKGVAWDREFRRRLAAEGQRENVERAERPGVDVTPPEAPSEVRLPWAIHGVRFNTRAA